LSRDDFCHISKEWDALANALKSKEPINILLSGAPGTGKTQLALALCKACGKHTALVKSDSMHHSGEDRRVALTVGHKLLATTGDAVLIVDEAESLLDGETYSGRRTRRATSSKSFLNNFLENAEIPMIWIVNDPDVLDQSVLRRFTWVVPLEIPPRSARRRILDRYLTGLVPDSLLEELSERDDLPPYEAARLGKIAAIAGGQAIEQVHLALDLADRLFERRHTLKVRSPMIFDASLLNLDIPLAPLMQGIACSGRGKLGFFGEPGTGKSMLAGEIAQRLDRPLLVQSGSDLLGSYVGETEANIAHAFQRATDEHAVLFLDEVDGLAGSRGLARQSWERSQTNELLLQLERFEGVAILATNFREVLDPALARRLDVKLQFKALRPEQAWQLFQQHAGAAGADLERRVKAIPLRLGDFSAALRRLEILQESATAEGGDALLRALQGELANRQDNTNHMGF